MATKVDCISYLPGYYYSMRDLNEDSSSSSWPICYGDTAAADGQYYNGFMPRTLVDGYPGHEKDALKQKMLEHEAVFRNQVYELHRLYRIQRDMMEEFKRKELHRLRASMEQPSSSSSLKGSQMPSQDARKWHMAGIPLLNSDYERTSMSRVEIENSPVSCTKGYNNNTQPSHFPFQNGSSLKESEPSDSRPLKVRKKLFDLQLLADEYIDTEEGEQLSESNVHSGSIRLADLNKPVEIEETMASSTVDFIDQSFINGEKKGENHHPGKSNAGYSGVNGGSLHIRDGSLFKSSVGSIVNERGWFSHLYEAGSTKSNLSSVIHGLLQKEKMPIPSQPVPGSDPFFSSCFSSSWAHPVPSWTKPTNSFTQKLTTMEPCLDSPAATDRKLQTKAQSGGNRLASASSYLNQHSGGELTAINGFYHGSASGSKEIKAQLPSARLDYVNCNSGDNVASDRSNNRAYGYSPKGDSKPAVDINLNEAEDGKSEPEDHLSALPWLKRKPKEGANKLCCKSQTVTDLNQPSTPKVSSALSDCEIVRTAETQNVKKILGIPIFEKGASQNVLSSHVSTSASIACREEKKNRIIDINLECEPDEEISTAELTVEKEKAPTKGAFVRDYIDLNSCISDFINEDALAPSYESKAASVKISFEIDLEAPAENEDDMVVEASLQLLQNKNETLHDEILKNAAETMVAISSSSCPEIHSNGNFRPLDASLAQSLTWLANQLETNESTVNDGPPREEMDDFEAMTLQIQETKEDYMPAPFVPEFQNVEGTGPATTTTTNNNNTLGPRSRRGQSRRGRQRRDFQRDILPGLASLSRHEVTEDIQTFGGLMRATGHHWVSGLTRRNGSRGRRRAVIESVSAISVSNNQACTPLVRQVSKNIDGGLEDRSLTGWGKTTRRPRRQRCPAGNNSNSNNPPAVVLA